MINSDSGFITHFLYTMRLHVILDLIDKVVLDSLVRLMVSFDFVCEMAKIEFSFSQKSESCVIQEVEDAQKIRRTVIDCFEKAVLPGLSDEERRTNLHFVIVGGGPTGVEFAAELHDFVHDDLVKLYPSVKDLVKITVIQSGDHILNT